MASLIALYLFVAIALYSVSGIQTLSDAAMRFVGIICLPVVRFMQVCVGCLQRAWDFITGIFK